MLSDHYHQITDKVPYLTIPTRKLVFTPLYNDEWFSDRFRQKLNLFSLPLTTIRIVCNYNQKGKKNSKKPRQRTVFQSLTFTKLWVVYYGHEALPLSLVDDPTIIDGRERRMKRAVTGS